LTLAGPASWTSPVSPAFACGSRVKASRATGAEAIVPATARSKSVRRARACASGTAGTIAHPRALAPRIAATAMPAPRRAERVCRIVAWGGRAAARSHATTRPGYATCLPARPAPSARPAPGTRSVPRGSAPPRTPGPGRPTGREDHARSIARSPNVRRDRSAYRSNRPTAIAWPRATRPLGAEPATSAPPSTCQAVCRTAASAGRVERLCCATGRPGYAFLRLRIPRMVERMPASHATSGPMRQDSAQTPWAEAEAAPVDLVPEAPLGPASLPKAPILSPHAA